MLLVNYHMDMYTERGGYIIWGRLGIHGEYPFAGGDAQFSIILHELIKRVSKKPQ